MKLQNTKLKSLIILSIFTLSSLALAHDNPTQTTKCYTFSNKKSTKVMSTGKCTVESGGGAGGYWINIHFKGKEHSFEYSHDDENQGYARHAKTLKALSQQQITNSTPLLFCDKYESYDICYK